MPTNWRRERLLSTGVSPSEHFEKNVLSWAQRSVGFRLRDDIGQQIVLDHGDLIFQPQFAFFEASDLQLVLRARFRERGDRSVKIAVFRAEQFELFFKLSLIHLVAPL